MLIYIHFCVIICEERKYCLKILERCCYIMSKEGMSVSLCDITVSEAYIIYRFRNDEKIRRLLNAVLNIGLPEEQLVVCGAEGKKEDR